MSPRQVSRTLPSGAESKKNEVLAHYAILALLLTALTTRWPSIHTLTIVGIESILYIIIALTILDKKSIVTIFPTALILIIINIPHSIIPIKNLPVAIQLAIILGAVSIILLITTLTTNHYINRKRDTKIR